MAETAARQRMVLSESKVLRRFSFFLLYIGQGLPLGVSTVAIPAWLVANGRRRAWLILAKLLMVAGFAIAAFVAPGPDDLGSFSTSSC